MGRHARASALGLAIGLGTAMPATAAGTLAFFATGEGLATRGFVEPQRTKDGWTLRFDHVFVTLAEIAAHQAEPPYDARQGGAIAAVATVGLDGVRTLDVVQGDADDRLLVAAVAAPEGHFNAVSWRMAPAADGPHAGYAMVFVGTAERDGAAARFVLRSAETRAYRCGEYVGDERKGFVVAGATADVELTFHLDHVFGRADRPADDPMNVAALGFDPFAAGGDHAISLEGLHIGHAGEGHCHVVAD